MIIKNITIMKILITVTIKIETISNEKTLILRWK